MIGLEDHKARLQIHYKDSIAQIKKEVEEKKAEYGADSAFITGKQMAIKDYEDRLTNIDQCARIEMARDISGISEHIDNSRITDNGQDMSDFNLQTKLQRLGIDKESDPQLYNSIRNARQWDSNAVRGQMAERAGLQMPTKEEVKEAYDALRSDFSQENRNKYKQACLESGLQCKSISGEVGVLNKNYLGMMNSVLENAREGYTQSLRTGDTDKASQDIKGVATMDSAKDENDMGEINDD